MKWVKTAKLDGVSLCMIVKDEENNPAGGIDNFLRHHLPMVDEAIVVDTGSNDRTVEIAGSYDKVRLLDYSWDGSFSNARNFSLENANYDHILVLDADEKLQHTGLIKPVLPTFFEKLFGYEFCFVNIGQDGTRKRITNHGDPDNYRHRVRYFMNLPCLRFRGNVHEQLEDIDNATIHDFISGHSVVGLVVNHYLPSEQKLERKREWYKSLREPVMAVA